MAYQGFYKVKYPEKYKGDPTNVVFRSSWERKFMLWCERNPNVISWQSEEFHIPYMNPITGRKARYFPDFRITLKTNEGIETWLIEIKPAIQVKKPEKKSRITKKYINEVKTFAINTYKWSAAERYCKERGYKFVILTEKELNIRG